MRARSVRQASLRSGGIAWPSKLTLPSLGRSSPRARRPVVDLPQPDSPTMPKVRPGASDRLTSSTARTGTGRPRKPRRLA
jgi:hypothetical protein